MIEKTTWVRANLAGILRFHVSTGDPVRADQAIATNHSILSEGHSLIRSPVDGIILGMATMPAVKPGEPICHIAIPEPKHSMSALGRDMDNEADESIQSQVRRDLATNFSLIDPPPNETPPLPKA